MRVVRRPSSPLPARAGVVARGSLLALTVAALPACATSRAVDADDAHLARLMLAASTPGHVSTVGDVSTRFIQGAALSRDPMRPLADVIGSYWRITARRDPRAARALIGDDEVAVYAGMAYLGGWEHLRTLRSSDVTRVQRLTMSEAYHRYGRQHANGAIVLTMRSAAR